LIAAAPKESGTNATVATFAAKREFRNAFKSFSRNLLAKTEFNG
jgi:hypothetical protein